jgi:hypothetical protein
MLLVSVPSILTAPGAVDGVWPLLVHFGPVTGEVVQEKGDDSDVDVPDAGPEVKGTLFEICKELLAELRDGLCLPPQILPAALREALGPEEAETYTYPAQLINLSDWKAVTETADDICAPSVPQFPGTWHDGPTCFRCTFHYMSSAGCRCTIADQISDNYACDSTKVRPTCCFFSGLSTPHWYGRHGQLHGLPCLMADVAVYFWNLGEHDAALAVASVFPGTEYEPLRHCRDPPVWKKGIGNSLRPPHSVRLKEVKAVVYETTPCAVGDPVAEWIRRGRTTRLSLGACILVLDKLAKRHPELAGIGELVGDAWRYSLTLLRPQEHLRDDSPAGRAAVRDLGRDVWKRYKRMLSASMPWAVDETAPWFQRYMHGGARGRNPPPRPDVAAAFRRITFRWNAVACAQSAHEFFVHGAAPIMAHGRAAGAVHEEAFEHFLLYGWALGEHLAGGIPSPILAMKWAAKYLFLVPLAGSPRLSGTGREAVAKVYGRVVEAEEGEGAQRPAGRRPNAVI